MTLFRFMNIFYRFNKSAKSKTTIVNMPMDVLLYFETVFLTKQLRYYVFVINSQTENQLKQENITEQKIKQLNREILKYGKISKINICDILNDIKKSGTVTSLQGLFLLKCCKELTIDSTPNLRQKLGDEIWETLKQFDVTLDVSHYNALLAIYLENETEFSPLEFLDEMNNKNIKPNKVTYERLVSYFCNIGKVKEATQILKYLKNQEMSLNENILSSLIFGHSINNNMDAAFEILKNMESLNITKTIKTYSVIMYAYAIKGNIESIKKTIAECEAKEIWIPVKVFLTIMYYLSINGFTEYIDEILTDMPKSSIYVKEANKIIYKLFNKQQENIAFKIFETLPKSASGENIINENFFIETLINFKMPIEKSIVYYNMMTKENSNPFISTIHKSMEYEMYESSIALMKAWKNIGGFINERYFYPIFYAFGQLDQFENVEKMLEKIVVELKMQPSIYMLNMHILPYMQYDINKIFSILVNCHVNVNNIANAILLHLLSRNKICEAAHYLNTYYYFSYKKDMIKYSLLQALKNTEDVSSFVKVLHYFYKTELNRHREKDYMTFFTFCILEAINILSLKNQYLLLVFFRNLIDKGLSIPPEAIQTIEKQFSNKMTPEIHNALDILKFGNLVLKPPPIHYNNFFREKFLDVEKLENIIQQDATSNSVIDTQINNLLIYYCNINNEEKVNELLKKYEKTYVPISLSTYNKILAMYLELNQTDKTEFYLNRIKKEYPSFSMKHSLCLKLVTAFVKEGNIEKAKNYISYPKYHKLLISLNKCHKLLMDLLKYNDEELLHQFFDLLCTYGYIVTMKNIFLAPFIELHLSRDDKNAIIRKFEWAYKTYKLIPLKKKLMKKFISDGDNDSLERIQQICTKLLGKTIASFYLAVSYLECNNLTTAKNIIQNNCSHLYEELIVNYVENKYKSGNIDHLERLFDVLNDLQYDVENICTSLLKSYSSLNQWDKCNELWLKMMKSDIKPSDNFINLLNFILMNRNINENKILEDFKNALQQNNLSDAVNYLDGIPFIYKSDCYSLLCKEYTKINNFTKAVNLWQELNQQYNLDLTLNTAEYILSILVKQNCMDNIEKIETFLSPQYKKQIDFNFYLNQAYLKSGLWKVYLKNLEIKLINGTINKNNLNLDYKTAIQSLINYPEIYIDFESLAYKFLDKGILSPINAIWIYYFLQKDTKAEEIWLKYIQNSEAHLWLEVINFSKFKNDPELYLKIAKLVQKSSLKEKKKLATYSGIIKSCMKLGHKEKYEYSLKCLKVGLSEFFMDDFDINLLVNLQKGLEKCGLQWPWTIKQNKM